ncbi:hypothetical protein MNV49_000487 [Pseudohyphozyma bogoriensis]|nr:hypothetical protein MNV49_000487 [Pseudohyphozyma bogoriensis]
MGLCGLFSSKKAPTPSPAPTAEPTAPISRTDKGKGKEKERPPDADGEPAPLPSSRRPSRATPTTPQSPRTSIFGLPRLEMGAGEVNDLESALTFGGERKRRHKGKGRAGSQTTASSVGPTEDELDMLFGMMDAREPSSPRSRAMSSTRSIQRSVNGSVDSGAPPPQQPDVLRQLMF